MDALLFFLLSTTSDTRGGDFQYLMALARFTYNPFATMLCLDIWTESRMIASKMDSRLQSKALELTHVSVHHMQVTIAPFYEVNASGSQ